MGTLEELLKLSEAVDVICEAAERENKVKEDALNQKLSARWEQMWSDLERIIPAVESLHYEGCRHIGGYAYGYPFGYKATGPNCLTFIYNEGHPVEVYMDYAGGWAKITKNDFNRSMDRSSECTEMLLREWGKVYQKMETDIENRLGKDIKNRIGKCSDRTKMLNEKLSSM